MTWEGTNEESSFHSCYEHYNPSYLHCIVYMCRGRGVCKLVYHHIPNTKLTQRDDNIIASRIAISYLHTDTRESVLQYYVSCKGLNVTATIHTAHAQKHFSPETKSKVRPKFFFARAGHIPTTIRHSQIRMVSMCWNSVRDASLATRSLERA